MKYFHFLKLMEINLIIVYLHRCLRKLNAREDKSPLFLYQEMLKKQVEDLLQAALNERQDLFLIDFNFSGDHAVKIVIDGDNGVLVEDCIFISRSIEHNIDKDAYDFSLEVLSSGAATPLVLPRQYNKHIGRSLEVVTLDNKKIEGELNAVNTEGVVLKWKAREPKPVGKGKVTVAKEANIAFNDIKEAKVKIKF
ncbi:MAG: ribosome assembly cofactor RimP [Winogradskyella sp.]